MANIAEYLKQIKTAIFGRDVRNSIHDSIDAINKDYSKRLSEQDKIINNNTTKQNLLEQKYDEQIKNIASSEPQNAEIVDARAGFPTLGSIIKQKIYHFENVEEMKNCLTLVPGDVVETLGYYSTNDGGGAKYLIREKVDTDDEDNGSIHFLQNNLVAEIILKNYAKPEQYGAKGDGENDDSKAINNMIAKNDNCRFNSKKTYYIENPINIDREVYLDFNKSTLKCGNIDYAINCQNSARPNFFPIIRNIVINGNYICGIGVYVTGCRWLKLYDSIIFNCKTACVKVVKDDIQGRGNIFVDQFHYYNVYDEVLFDNVKNSVAVDFSETTDAGISNGVTNNFKVSFKVGSSCWYENIHSWNWLEQILEGSTMFDTKNSCIIENCFCDSIMHFIDATNGTIYTNITVTNSTFHYPLNADTTHEPVPILKGSEPNILITNCQFNVEWNNYTKVNVANNLNNLLIENSSYLGVNYQIIPKMLKSKYLGLTRNDTNATFNGQYLIKDEYKLKFEISFDVAFTGNLEVEITDTSFINRFSEYLTGGIIFAVKNPYNTPIPVVGHYDSTNHIFKFIALENVTALRVEYTGIYNQNNSI
ncbi:MAG: hypothetical protein J6A89_04175 [Clostridia bacterium]|nr:hypothetical protein [Clostridia bacterium]